MNQNLAQICKYVRTTRIENCDETLQAHVRKCFLDLAMVTACGTRNPSSKLAADYAHNILPGNDATVWRTGKKASLLGATVANAAAANALDMDDGYSMTKGHPGAGIIAGILAAAEKAESTFGDVLSALLVGYELSMRQGLCLQDYYNFYHSTGAYAGFGTAAAVCKLFDASDEQLCNALGIADYYGPLVPCMRTVREPSLNKDGIYLGAKLGMEAVLLSRHGIDGKAHLLGDEAYTELVQSLGKKHYVYDLYFKFFSCCRWAQGALTAIRCMEKVDPAQIGKIDVYSYGASGELYGGVPENEMQAQYNMRYPIAVYLLQGDFGPLQSSISIDSSDAVKELMGKISFEIEPEYEKAFPAKRYTRVEITLHDGTRLRSGATEPLGEPTSGVSMEQIAQKGMKINGLYNDPDKVAAVIETIEKANYSDKFAPILQAVLEIAQVNSEDEHD